MKTVEQMAREAGFQITPNRASVPPYYIYGNTYTLLFFAQSLMEECAAMCAQHEAKRWEAYRGRGGRDQAGFAYNPYTEGESDGASKCVELIRAAAKDLK